MERQAIVVFCQSHPLPYSTVWFNSLCTNFVPGVNSGNMYRTVENLSVV